MKVQVNLSDNLVKKIDMYAKKMGVSRSALCGVWIGQAVMNLENATVIGQKMMKELMGTLNEKS